jgi:IMP dehydrogenase
MTAENLITVPLDTSLEDAEKLLHKHRIEKLLVINESGDLAGLITVKDIKKKQQYPHACKDKNGRLRVAAAVGVAGDTSERVKELVNAEVDVIVVDTAHGHSRGVLDTISQLKSQNNNISIIAGNVATSFGAEALIDAGVDCVKVGINYSSQLRYSNTSNNSSGTTSACSDSNFHAVYSCINKSFSSKTSSNITSND